jgi:uncharacterized membrane protein
MAFWQFLGDLHPKLVQFPLVLLLAGLSFDAVGLLARSARSHFAGRALSLAGVLFLLFAFICGIYAEIWAGRAGIPQEQIEWHELFANVASWGFVVLTAWRILLRDDRRRALAAYTVAGFCWYGLLVATGYLGGRLVFEYGAAVVGGRADDVLTLHDLNVLATRQTDANLRYSELLHHIAGWSTLAIAAAIGVETLLRWRSPSRSQSGSDKLAWASPLILFLGGLALFLFADRDLYRLTDLRQLGDREVQLHKALAVLLATLGGVGLLRLGRPRPSKLRESTPSKVVAIMALIGGGLLFTHVHTVAPYANVAAGVYIAHVVMGLTALAIGAVRLAEDAVPRGRRVFEVLFVVLLGAESLLLISYNEGLPWYIGYGRYQRWGTAADGARDERAPIAPYGPIRAQLDFQPRTGSLIVAVKDRFTEAPVPIPARQIELRVSRGYEEVGIPLTADATGTRFSGTAPSLANAMAFSARAELPVKGVMTMGYFDPWVTPAIRPIPPNRVARFQCPMHDGIVAEVSGMCPLCGMPLVPFHRVPPTEMHAADFDMRLDTEPLGSAVTAPVELRLTPLRQGSVLRGLMIVHEHPLHLIVVSADLDFFDHVHPILRPDGSLVLPYRFPRPGPYLLYAEITPAAERAQVFRLAVAVQANARDPALATVDPPLDPSPSLSKTVDDDPSLTAELRFQPRTPVAGLETHFLLRLAATGAPVTDLEPYLGAMAHAIIVSEDTNTFLHSHPEEVAPPSPTAHGGPDIPFATFFPRPGRYKLWIQFQRGGRTHVVSYVVDVGSPLLPARVVRFLLGD